MAKEKKAVEVAEVAALNVKWPEWADLLIARGLTVEQANAKLAQLASRFPGGVIPEQMLLAWVDSVFDASKIQAKLLEVAAAAAKVYATGKGPVAHSSVGLA